MALGTIVLAITSIWNSIETKKLVKFQLDPNIYFDVEALSATNYQTSGSNQYVPNDLFQKNPELTIEVLNAGQRSTKIFSIYVYGSCLSKFKDSGNRLSLTPADGAIIKPQDTFKFKTTILPEYFNKNVSLPCDLNFVLNSDAIVKQDLIQLT